MAVHGERRRAEELGQAGVGGEVDPMGEDAAGIAALQGRSSDNSISFARRAGHGFAND
jgi:hypothetical protein